MIFAASGILKHGKHITYYIHSREQKTEAARIFHNFCAAAHLRRRSGAYRRQALASGSMGREAFTHVFGKKGDYNKKGAVPKE